MNNLKRSYTINHKTTKLFINIKVSFVSVINKNYRLQGTLLSSVLGKDQVSGDISVKSSFPKSYPIFKRLFDTLYNELSSFFFKKFANRSNLLLKYFSSYNI